MYSDSFSARSNVAMGTRERRRSSTGDVGLVQKDIDKAVQLLNNDTAITRQRLLLPVKMEAIGTPSSIDSTEDPSLYSTMTTVTQAAVTTDDVINLDTQVTNDNTHVANDSNMSEC